MHNTQISVSPISLPPEIWLDILAVLRNSLTEEEETRKHKTIDNIVLVSRSYRDLIQPLLFETFTITMDRGPGLRWLVPRLEGLVAFFNYQPYAARWIKTLVILRRGSFKLRRDEVALLELVFLRMTNIRSLHVVHLNITQAMYAHLYQLPGLENFNIEPNPGNPPLNGTVLPYGRLKIRKLRLGGRSLTSESATAAFMQLALSPHLQQLQIGAQSLAQSAWSLCTTYPKHSFSSLTSLTTAPPGPNHISSFFHFLAFCPTITELRLSFPYSDYFNEGRQLEGDLVTQNVIPRLSILHSPTSFANVLVPGRPITELRVTGPQDLTLEDLRGFSLGSKDILRLDLGRLWCYLPNPIGSVADMFPCLKSLDLYSGVVSSTQEAFVDDIAQLPDLERLYLSNWARNRYSEEFIIDTLDKQKQCLDSIRVQQSSLREVCFDWNQTWWWTDGKGWKHQDADEDNEDYDLDAAMGL